MHNMAQKYDLRQSANLEALELYIYSDVVEDGQNLLTGEARKSETSAESVREKLEAAGEVKALNVYINSLGGSVKEGISIYNQLKRHSAYKTVYIDGFACSVASVIAMAGDRVVMPRNTMMMIHNASMAAFGNAADLRKCADDLDVISEASRQAYLLRAGDKLSKDRLREMMDQETWLTAAQCVELGLADEFADTIDLEPAQAMLQKAGIAAEPGPHNEVRTAAPEKAGDIAASKEQKVNLLSALIRAYGKEE